MSNSQAAWELLNKSGEGPRTPGRPTNQLLSSSHNKSPADLLFSSPPNSSGNFNTPSRQNGPLNIRQFLASEFKNTTPARMLGGVSMGNSRDSFTTSSWTQQSNRHAPWRANFSREDRMSEQSQSRYLPQDSAPSSHPSSGCFFSEEIESYQSSNNSLPHHNFEESPRKDGCNRELNADQVIKLLEGKGMDDILEKLSDEQKFVLTLVINGKSVFFTGAAGTGKSFLLRAVKEAFNCLGRTSEMFVTGTTGIASVNIGGVTLHSFSGIGLGKGTEKEVVEKAYHSKARRRWEECKILVIDEISMLDAETFDKVEATARYCKRNSAPFGGVQVILCGDFFQLPPVGIGQRNVRFCFHSKAWGKVIEVAVVLTKIFRQNNLEFISLLNEVRIGRLSATSLQALNHKVMEYQSLSNPYAGDLKPTRLFALNRDVDQVNASEMMKLETNPHSYRAKDHSENETYERLLQNLRAPQELILKKNCQVILLTNLDLSKGLVNGSTGIVVGFQYCDDYADWGKLPVVQFQDIDGNLLDKCRIHPHIWTMNQGKKVMAEREQVPLQLAWAMSIHKSQGLTISNLEVNLGNNVFDYGQAYVALSRSTDLKSLRITEFSPHVVRAHPEIHQFYNQLQSIDMIKGVGMSLKTSNQTLSTGSSVWMSKRKKMEQTDNNDDEWLCGNYKKITNSHIISQAACNISEEQRKRMEENRRNALARLQDKKKQS